MEYESNPIEEFVITDQGPQAWLGATVLLGVLQPEPGYDLEIIHMLFSQTNSADVGNRTISISVQDKRDIYNYSRHYLKTLAASASIAFQIGHAAPNSDATSTTNFQAIGGAGFWVKEGNMLRYKATSVFAGDRLHARILYRRWKRKMW